MDFYATTLKKNVKSHSYFYVNRQIARTNFKGIKEDNNKGGRGWACKFVLILYEEQTIGSDVKHPSDLG